MNISIISLQNMQRMLAILAILALVFGPFSKVFMAHAFVAVDSVCSVEVVSDTSNTFTKTDTDAAANAVLSWIHPGWTAVIDGAQWIWGTNLVEDPSATTTETFVKTFDWNGPVTDATLKIASDNGYLVTINGNTIASTTSNNFTLADQDTITVPSEDIVQGSNTLQIAVTNDAWATTDPQTNPAGLLYKLTVNGTNPLCQTVPTSTITIVKNFNEGDEPTDPWSFNFTSTSTIGDFSLSNSANSTTTKLLDAGTYNIAEASSTGWEAPSVSCGSDNELSAFSNIVNGETINLANGEHVTCTFTNHLKKVETPAPVCIGNNLIQNASFEDPLIQSTDIGAGSYAGGYYEDFTSIPNWTSSSADGFEVWNNMFGGASDPAQNLELDVNHPTNVSQMVPTVVGNKYKVSYDFAARPGTGSADNILNLAIDGVNVGDSVTADGGALDSSSVWTSHYYEFTAATTSTKIEFRDMGASNGFGSLLDNTAVCLTQDNQEIPVRTYHIFGNVWNDVNGNNATDTDEANLGGLIIQITNGTITSTTTTDENGAYYFDVPEGTWTITEDHGEDWTVTYPDTGSHTVTVPTPEPPLEAEAPQQSIFASILNVIVPTAYASVLPPAPRFGPFNFGNAAVVHSTTTSRPNGGGAYISLSGGNGNSNNDNGQVLGASTSTTPTPVVPVVIPVGAPNTGAGGTSALVVNLPIFSAILSSRMRVRSK